MSDGVNHQITEIC